MARITILGGTGYAGGAIVAEAARRGHDVTAVSRGAVEQPVAGVDYVTGSATDGSVLDEVVAGRDAVIVALSPRGDMAGKVEAIVDDLVARLADTPTRLGYVGGASSLQVEEGGPRLWDLSKDHLPDDVRPEIETGGSSPRKRPARASTSSRPRVSIRSSSSELTAAMCTTL